MALQVYHCPDHGDFHIHVPTDENRPMTQPCPTTPVKGQLHDMALETSIRVTEEPTICGKESPWRPSAPSVIVVEGGTGAGRLRHTR